MDRLNPSVRKVLAGVPANSAFTFVPVVETLPVKNICIEEQISGGLTGNSYENIAMSHEKRSRGNMSDGEIIKAKIVFIRDSVEGTGNIQPGTEQLKPSPDHVSLSQTKARSENTCNHVSAETASMETAVDKYRGISQQQCHDASGRVEVNLGCCTNRLSVSEDRTSPTNSAELFPTLASSRESVLSEASDKERSWQLSSLTSPVSLSRTVSACSSVRSGAFTPAIIQMKRHFLAPGSSLIHTPQNCFSSCESLSSSSVCTDHHPRHRPPLTRLSLLTAILRKGRLPVLSSVLQRPYTPCWPVNPVTLGFCSACSAASSVASIPLELSSWISSTTSVDSQNPDHREPNRCTIASPTVQLNRTGPQAPVKICSEQHCSSSVPQWKQVVSPPPVKSYTLPRIPLPLFCSNFHSVSPVKHDKTDCAASKTLLHAHISTTQSPELKSSDGHVFHKGRRHNNLKKLISPEPKLINDPDTQKLSQRPNSSLSRLQSLSQQLRCRPICPAHLQPSHSCTTIFSARTGPESCLSRFQNTSASGEPHKGCLDPKSAPLSQGRHKAFGTLSPSRYTPIVFSGWPSPIDSPTPTPSPAPPTRDLTPSPSHSLRSTPSPRPGSGISDCSDREGKKRKTHKIKLSYKSLAAIPTNTLLLDQQAIDEQVERQESDTLHRGVTSDGGIPDTHGDMCSPAQLRQQSEELYAVIDEILANSIPASTKSSKTSVGLQNSTSLPKSLGRETKYASVCSLHPSAERGGKWTCPKPTKPGVIRPMTAIPRLTVEDKDDFHTNTLKQSLFKQTSTDNKKVEKVTPEEAKTGLYKGSQGKMMRKEMKTEIRPFSTYDLQIIEPEEQLSRCGKDASNTFSVNERHIETFETHI
ncbi:uncharacterized protein mlip [Pholidichthys leucotaenia]